MASEGTRNVGAWVPDLDSSVSLDAHVCLTRKAALQAAVKSVIASLYALVGVFVKHFVFSCEVAQASVRVSSPASYRHY